MKTVSLRSFRVQMPTEPVVVVVRRGGELVTLGTWTPNEAPSPVSLPPNIYHEPQTAGVLQRERLLDARPFTPAPKPGKR